MQQQHTAFTVSRMCQLLEVARSGYYEWLSRPPRAQVEADQHVETKIKHYFTQGRGTYGTRRIKYLLASEGLMSISMAALTPERIARAFSIRA
jgi:putative transposase